MIDREGEGGQRSELGRGVIGRVEGGQKFEWEYSGAKDMRSKDHGVEFILRGAL